MHQLTNELKTLKAVKKAMNDKRHRNEVSLLTNLIGEVYQAVKAKGTKYFVHFTKDEYMEHVIRYENMARKQKNKALAMLQEIHAELNQNNIKRCNVLMTELIETNFFIKSTQEKLSMWHPVSKQQFRKAYFTV